MKKIFFKIAFSLVVILLCKTTAYSQFLNCQEIYNPDLQTNNAVNAPPAFPSPTSTTTTLSGQNPDDSRYIDTQHSKKYVYRVIYHVVRNGAGVRYTGDVGESECMNSIMNLNVAYNQFNIFFKYGGIKYEDKDELVGDFWQGQITLSNSPYRPLYDKNNFHIFILDGNILNSSNNIVSIVPGYGPLIYTTSFYTFAGFKAARVVIHEVGHNFYLYHDFKNYGSSFASENVIRDYTTPNVGYNASGSGDQIHDTPATKIWSDNQYNELGIYHGLDIDFNTSLLATDINRLYKTEQPRNNNVMHVHEGNDYESGYYLSPGQGKRIRWVLAVDQSANYHYYSDAEIPAEELYKPFETVSFVGNTIIRVTDNGDGTADVCRNRNVKSRFQKGFNYSFYVGDELLAQSNPNELKELDGFIFNLNKVLLNEYSTSHTYDKDPECGRSLICTTEPFIRGIVFSTEILGSMNITVQELNELQVKDPELFNNLLEQYYYILKKVTASGAEVKTVFYKQ
jgi:hypothetical protein